MVSRGINFVCEEAEKNNTPRAEGTKLSLSEGDNLNFYSYC